MKQLLTAALLGGVLLATSHVLVAAETAAVEYREVELSYPAEAVVEAVRQATVAAQVHGRVIEVKRDAGDRVRQGELLMRIDEREASFAEAGAEARIAQAQANLANASAEHERTRRLVAKKFVSQAALDQAEAAHRAAEAELAAALAGRSQSATARTFTVVTSPLGGVVAQRHTELGEMASPGKPLITVFDPRDLRVVADIPQYKLAEVGRTRKARVHFPESDRWLDAASITVLPSAEPRTHTVRVRIDLPEDVSGVVPGMFARAHLVTGRAKKLLAPATAVLRRGELTAAYVVGDRGSVRLRQIRLGDYQAGGWIEVLAGLSAGELVALDPVKAGVQRGQPAIESVQSK